LRREAVLVSGELAERQLAEVVLEGAVDVVGEVGLGQGDGQGYLVGEGEVARAGLAAS
jgi:hypothetical protein